MSQAEKGLPSYVEPTFSRWKDETLKSWIWRALNPNGKERVRVGWIGNMKPRGMYPMTTRVNRIARHMKIGGIISRSLFIEYTDVKLWNKFAATCLLPYYMEGKYWANPHAENYRLVNFAAVARIERYDRKYVVYGRDVKFRQYHEPTTLMTVFNTALGKRLIVDGVHRASAIVNFVFNNKRLPTKGVEILELAGPMLHLYFPYDFASMIVEELLNIKPPMEL